MTVRVRLHASMEGERFRLGLIVALIGLLSLSARAYQIDAWGEVAWWDQVTNAPAGNDFTAIAIGDASCLALRADGSIAAWGDNSAVVSGAPTGTNFKAIATNGVQAYALRTDGSIAAWGDFGNMYGNLPPTEAGFKAVYAPDVNFGFALRADGSIAAWGNGNDLVSGAPSGTGFTSIAAGYSAAYALRADGSIAVWGGKSDLDLASCQERRQGPVSRPSPLVQSIASPCVRMGRSPHGVEI